MKIQSVLNAYLMSVYSYGLIINPIYWPWFVQQVQIYNMSVMDQALRICDLVVLSRRCLKGYFLYCF